MSKESLGSLSMAEVTRGCVLVSDGIAGPRQLLCSQLVQGCPVGSTALLLLS